MKTASTAIFICLVLMGAAGFDFEVLADVSALFDKGRERMRSDKYEEAVRAFSDALEFLGPDEKNAHVVMLSRARAYYQLGQFKNARKDVERVLKSGAADGETQASGFLVRGMIYRRDGQDGRAIADFTSAIKAPHENDALRSGAFANRGIAYLDAGDAHKAISDLNKAIELDPNYAFAYAARGLAYLRQDKIEAARADGERAMRLKPDPAAEKIARTILDELSVSATGPQSVSVPITEQGHVFVQVRFGKNGKPHRFLLDTGATHSLVDNALLNEIKKETDVRTVGKGRVRIADGSTHTVTRYKVKNAFLFNMPLGETEVLVLDVQGKKIVNLLGVKSLQNISVSFDGSAGRVELRRTTPRTPGEIGE
jgi:tetratricopeptide (TPR) repeat protein